MVASSTARCWSRVSRSRAAAESVSTFRVSASNPALAPAVGGTAHLVTGELAGPALEVGPLTELPGELDAGRLTPPLVLQHLHRRLGPDRERCRGEQWPERREAHRRPDPLGMDRAPALEVRREGVPDGERGSRIRPLEGEVQVAIVPECERSPVPRGDDSSVHGAGQHELRRGDLIDEGVKRLPARSKRGADDLLAPGEREDLGIAPRVEDVGDADRPSGRHRVGPVFVEGRDQEGRVTHGDGIAQPQGRATERTPDGEDLRAGQVLGAQTVLGAHSAAPEHHAIVERIDAFPARREEHVVDDAADEVDTLTADGQRKEELLEQELGQEVAEVLAVSDARPVPNELSHDSLPTNLRAGHDLPPRLRALLTRRGVSRSRRRCRLGRDATPLGGRAHQPWVEPEESSRHPRSCPGRCRCGA